MFFDPPYSGEAGRCNTLYAVESLTVAHDVREWCLAHGTIKHMRIALCGYAGEHEALEAAGWDVVAWKAHCGYGAQGATRGRENSTRERIWFSPYCLPGQGAIAPEGTADVGADTAAVPMPDCQGDLFGGWQALARLARKRDKNGGTDAHMSARDGRG
jgi:hypothetical protein